jgi:hypothetical protein
MIIEPNVHIELEIKMEKTIESIPISLYGDISKRLIDIVLGTQEKNAIPTDLAKKIIYLWRQDQLATLVGITALVEASMKVDASKTRFALEELGLQKIALALQRHG